MINVFKKYGILRYCLLFVILLFVFYNVLQPTIYALSPEQKKLYDNGIYYYDKDGECKLDNSVPNSASNNKVYIMGDSYSVGIDSTLTKDLKAAGYDVVGKNEDNAGTITSNGGDGGTPAIDALDKDKAKIADAGSMVVLLGTNGGENDIPKFMDKLKTINPNIKVYWMTSGYNKAFDSDLQARNKVTRDFAAKYNYTITDWYGAYSKDKSLISGDNVHPTAKGYQTLSKLFVDAMGKFSAGTNSSTSGPDKYMTTDPKLSNEKRVYTFLTSPDGMGLTPAQAAGVMGNLNQESTGFNPGTIESNGVGIGIVQWSNERRTKLESAAQKQGKKVNDLDFQLNYMKKEIIQGYSPMLKALKKTNDVTEATYMFHGPTSESTGKIPKYDFSGFESSGDSPSMIEERVGDAKKFFKKYTGTDPVSLNSSGGDNKCLCTSEASKGAVAPESEFTKKFGKNKAVAWAAVGEKPTVYGDAKTMKAWSTSKVLVVAAYLKIKGSAGDQEENITKALRDSDNDAIIAVYNAGGGDATMPKTMTEILRSNGDKTTKIATEKNGAVTKEGQTIWSLENQVKFMSAMSEGKVVDKKSSEYILSKMKPIQKWGLGAISDNAYKPGWGGTDTRQMGLVTGADGKTYAVAIGQTKGSIPDEAGNTALAKWLQDNVLGKVGSSGGVENCPGTSGGGSLMQVVQDYAWEDGREVGSSGGEAKPAYMDATIKAFKDGKYTGAYSGDGLKGFFTDCGGFVTRAVQNSIDPNYNNTKKFKGPTPDQEGYLKATSDLYTALGPQKSTTSLQPGDIAVVNSGDGLGSSGHTFIYTGKINDSWKGNAASASGFSLVPHASNAYFSDDRGQYLWFRHK